MLEKKTKISNTLNLRHVKDLSIDAVFKNFEHPSKIEVIILDSLDLIEVPKSITRFTNLKHLSLACNPKLNLDQTIEQINALPIEFLNLQKNQITELPSNLPSLRSLTDINLAYNQLIKEINYQILGQVENLNEVWLDHNDLYELPQSIRELSQISRLYIGHNQLEILPKELVNMTRLKVLHAEYNNIKLFPEVFLETPSLLLVHLNNNRITKVPTSFAEHKTSVKGLILDNNPISEEERTWIEKEFSNFFLLSIQNNK